MSNDTESTSLVLPPTDRLTTESDTSSSSSSSTSHITETATELPDWSIGRVISLAPRADNSRYHDGATGPQQPLEQTSGFHFSTPDRTVNCSTGVNGSTTLACRLNDQPAEGNPPASAPSSCQWEANLAVLDSSGPQHGACADDTTVLYRSAIVDFGTTIAIGRFSCLVETDGTYCLESSSDTGFALTTTGYRKIYANERAPAALIGTSDTDSIPSTTATPS